MSYYWFNRKEILQKAKERYSKEKAAEYYLENNEAIMKNSRDWCKSLSKEEKDKIKEYQRKNISATDSVQKRSITKYMSFVFTQYKNEWKDTKMWQH